ncbi:hypothetical protein Tsubulata_041818 [Turnera subulata]|uniref:tRNA-binding domain-containing protein n=1 Tax=Turnera subulata TaxID=218843 RepID=A0A9Q0JDP3_9ROSI|nr:hypothetical protein Tsubulata_041818 [Turnera subulata]
MGDYSLGDNGEGDIKNLYLNILKSSGKWSPQKEDDEVLKWIGFAESFPVDSQACFSALSSLNEELAQKSVVSGNGLTPSEPDVIVFAVIHSSVIGLSNSEKEKLPHLMRWMDYIQSKEDFGKLFEKILLQKTGFAPPGTNGVAKQEVDSNAKKSTPVTKNLEKTESNNPKKSDTGKATEKQSTQEKTKPPQAETAEKDSELSVSLLNIQVGLICKAWKHPSADSLLVEEIDVGDAKLRQVVSGLAKYCSPDDLTVLCASNEDHTIVEPLLPPEGAKIGERVSFSGIDGKPEDVLNPKKKQLEKITPNLFTDEKGVATFKGIPFMTSCGPCTSSIPKASIK